MNKLFVVALLAGFGACFGFIDLPFTCRKEVDCGRNKCCFGSNINPFGIGICTPKLQANVPCNLASKHGCGCTEGLECRVYKTFTITSIDGKSISLKYRQCVAAAESPAVPENLNVYDEAGDQRSKRFLGITLPPLPTLPTLPPLPTIFRKCQQDSECGKDRCCSPVFGRCRPLTLDHLPCQSSSCCRSGSECRVTYSLYNPLTGKKIYDVKQCKPVDTPAEVQALEVTEE